MKAASRKGFTLIEILIVVIILGILAAIVIPQFTNASDDARKSSVASQLQTLRSAVELYKLHHGDSYPLDDGGLDERIATGGVWNWELLLTTTLSYDSRTVGPYLQQTPSNPMNNLNGMSINTADISGDGWAIDETGRLFATDKNQSNLLTY